jgi:hypothetical protein
MLKGIWYKQRIHKSNFQILDEHSHKNIIKTLNFLLSHTILLHFVIRCLLFVPLVFGTCKFRHLGNSKNSNMPIPSEALFLTSFSEISYTPSKDSFFARYSTRSFLSQRLKLLLFFLGTTFNGLQISTTVKVPNLNFLYSTFLSTVILFQDKRDLYYKEFQSINNEVYRISRIIFKSD